MSDIVDETPEEFSFPGPYEFSGEQVTIRVGPRNFLFESTPHGTLTYLSNSLAIDPDDEEPEPFDPAEYR